MPSGALEDAVGSIGTTPDGRTTREEIAAFVCRRFCGTASVDLLSTDVPTGRPGKS
ncbi:hypothetical protein [Streptomyces triticiradicis]|uniref:hypothetical protein n=1 Tax=Streptomyces triticiradicis TaxID=2651189 RepID=UPI001CECDC93|nr:hypothetical protein [Streptomyces triticiradicis]